MMISILMLMVPIYTGAQEAAAIRHRVQAQETFYSLSKSYDVTIDQIKAANPGMEYPKTGQFMLIPIQDNGKGYFIFKVMELKSTLAKVAEIHGAELRELEALNPQIEDRVWQGQEIKVPVVYYRSAGLPKTSQASEKIEEAEDIRPEQAKETKESPEAEGDCRPSDKNLKKTWKVALLVPLSLDKIPAREELEGLQVEEQLQAESFRFIRFYQGAVLAMDSLRKSGLKAELYVYDIDQDADKARQLVSKPVLKEMDLIIGPFFKNSFGVIAEFARSNDIPLVNPLSTRSDILTGHPEVFKVLPPRSAMPSELAQLVKKRFMDDQVILIHQGMPQQVQAVESLKSAIEKATDKHVIMVNYAVDSISGFTRKASTTEPNLVIIYAENEAMPLEVISRLHERRTTYSMTLVGLPEWDEFDHIENQYLMDLNTLLFSETFTDYSDSLTWDFIRSFRGRYATEPLELGYQGFDVTWFFMHALMQFGPEFRDCLDKVKVRLNHTRFVFRKVEDGGYENISWNIYRLADFQAIPVIP